MTTNLEHLSQKSKPIDISKGTDLNSVADDQGQLTNQVLIALLYRIDQVDFASRMPTDENGNPITRQKYFLVQVVEEVLRAAKEGDWGLAVQGDFIYLYNGEYWARVDRNEFKIFLGAAAERMGVLDLECRHYKYRNELFNQFLGVAYLPPPEAETEKTLINLQNGTLEVTPAGFKLRAFSRYDFLTYQLPFSYDPDADCPKFINFLYDVLPGDEGFKTQRVLAEYLGYVFTRHLKLEKMLVLFGSGANGKSVFFDIVNALLGADNISNYSLANLSEEHNRAMIVDKLLNYGSEIRGKIEPDLLKQMASNEPIQARLKYGNSFEAKRYAKLAFNSNELPIHVEHTTAFFRRFLIIPFDVTIPPDQRNPMLAREIIDNELPGVLNWVLIGLERLLHAKKFSVCPRSEEVLKTYMTESDSVAVFMDEEGHQRGTVARKGKELFLEYRSFCIDNGYRSVKVRNFYRRLRTLGFETQKLRDGTNVFLER